MDYIRQQEMEKALQDFTSDNNVISLGLKGMYWKFCFNMNTHPLRTMCVIALCVAVIWTFVTLGYGAGIFLACLLIAMNVLFKRLYWLCLDEARRMKYSDFCLYRHQQEQQRFRRFALYHLLKDYFRKYPEMNVSDLELWQMVDILDQ